MKPHCSIKSLFFSCALSAILVFSFQDKLLTQERTKNISLPEVGDTAPDFTLQGFDGKLFSISEMKNNKAVLLWFTNLCRRCEGKLSKVEHSKICLKKVGLRQLL